jgi:hypothetical protein
MPATRALEACGPAHGGQVLPARLLRGRPSLQLRQRSRVLLLHEETYYPSGSPERRGYPLYLPIFRVVCEHPNGVGGPHPRGRKAVPPCTGISQGPSVSRDHRILARSTNGSHVSVRLGSSLTPLSAVLELLFGSCPWIFTASGSTQYRPTAHRPTPEGIRPRQEVSSSKATGRKRAAL